MTRRQRIIIATITGRIRFCGFEYVLIFCFEMRNQNAKKNKTGKVATNFMLAPSHVSGEKKVRMRAPNNETKKDIRQPNKNKATIHVTATMSIHMPNWGDWYPIWISCTTAEKARSEEHTS